MDFVEANDVMLAYEVFEARGPRRAPPLILMRGHWPCRGRLLSSPRETRATVYLSPQMDGTLPQSVLR